MMENNNNSQSRAGRKPLGERAQTPAERKRRSRALRAERGALPFVIDLDKPLVDYVTAVAAQMQTTRAELTSQLLEGAIWRFKAAVCEADDLIKTGAPLSTVYGLLREQLDHIPRGATLKPETLQRIADFSTDSSNE